MNHACKRIIEHFRLNGAILALSEHFGPVLPFLKHFSETMGEMLEELEATR